LTTVAFVIRLWCSFALVRCCVAIAILQAIVKDHQQ